MGLSLLVTALGLLLVQQPGNAALPALPPPMGRIDHFVVLLMENRPFDHFFGCMDLPGADSGATPSRPRQLPIDPSKPHGRTVEVKCGTASYVCDGGNSYSTWKGKFAPDADVSRFPYGTQNDTYSYANGARGTAIEPFSAEQIPVKASLAKEFGVFNKMYSSVPAASTPNHLFTQSATSCGVADNILYSQCGGANATYPQMTIYDSLALANKSFSWYINSSLPHACDAYPKVCDHGSWDMDGDVNYPDMFMDGVGRHQENYHSYATFFEQAANGSLPHFSMIHPNDTWTDHPCNDVRKGERLTKDIYEALRAGKGWNKTLFLVVYDDAGGMYDHVTPPYAPADDAPCNIDNKPGPGPPPFDRPLQPASAAATSLGYQRQPRLLTAAEREIGMASRAPPMAVPSGDNVWRSRSDPPDLDGQTWVLLNAFAGDGRTQPMNTFVSFADTDAPPGMKAAQLWMRVPYTNPKEGMPLRFVEVESARSPAGRVYKMQNVFGGTPRGWITYEVDGTSQWFHANGAEAEAALVRVEQSDKAGKYLLLNLGKASGGHPPGGSVSYISFCADGLWVRTAGYRREQAMPVSLLKPFSPRPPMPPPTPPAPSPCPTKFDFRRLGLRTTALLISPLISAGTVIQEPKGPYHDSQFELSSVCSTAKHLFGVPGFLTKRDAWAGSFHELINLQTPRTDAPMHLPDAPTSQAQGVSDERRRLRQQDERTPRHCSAATAGVPGADACAADGSRLTMKQRNRMKVFAAMTHTEPPGEHQLAAMSKDEAAEWSHQRWAEWIRWGQSIKH